MHVYQVTDEEFVAGESPESCADFYHKATGCAEEQLDYGPPRPISPQRMRELLREEDDGTVRTFQESLERDLAEGRQTPYIFAVIDP